MRTLLLIATALGLSGSPARAEAEPAERPRTFETARRFTLDNGMKVVVDPSPSGERALVFVRYDAGARDDPEGFHGLAHLTEHLSFRRGKIMTAYDDLGATGFNAITGADETYYFAHLPVAALERAIWLESSRMAFLLEGLSQQDLDQERRIVLNEWEQNVHNSIELAPAVMKAMLPAGHPYLGLGDRPDDLQAIGLQHVQWYAQDVYQPSRATLVVVGSVDPEAVRGWAARYFGAVRAAHPPGKRTTAAALGPLARSCRVTVGKRAVDDSLILTWSAPARGSEEAAILDVVGALLVGPRRARLERALTHAQGPASSVGLTHEALALTSQLVLGVTARTDEDTDQILTIVDRELRAIADGALEAGELDAARRYVLRAHDEAMRSKLYRALALASEDGGAAVEQSRATYARVRPLDVKRVAARWLDPRRRVVAVLERRSGVRNRTRCEELDK